MRLTIAMTFLVHALLLMTLGCVRNGQAVRFGSLEFGGAVPERTTAALDAWSVPFLETAPTVNGEMSDWKDVPALEMHPADGPVRGRFRLGYDFDRFYLACEIVDPHFRNSGTPDTAGLQNCVIFDFDGLLGTGRSSPERMTFALTRRGPVTTWNILGGADPGACVIRKTGENTWVYEIALRWHDMQPIAPGIRDTFEFNVQYQYLDDRGRRRSVAWMRVNRSADRKYGAGKLAPLGVTVRGTHLYIGPGAFEVDKDGSIEWPVMVASDCKTPGAELVVEVALEGSDAPPMVDKTVLDIDTGLTSRVLKWNAGDAPGGRYTVTTKLVEPSGKVLASDSFRPYKRTPFDLKAEYEKLKPLYEKLRRSDNRFYRKDTDSVDLRMETLAKFAGREINRVQATQLERIARNTREVIEPMLAGRDYFAEARGWVVRGFRSPYDDTLQLYDLFIPKDYDPKKTYPLMVHLHGAGGNDPLKMLDGTYTARYFPDPDWQHIQMMPFARGRSSYRGLGLTEIFDTIDYTKKLYNIDPDRVYVKGFSMGGAGTWRVALRYPDRFAAANPRAGFTGLELYDRLSKPDAKRDWQTALAMTGCHLLHLENANNLPLFLYHGGSDPVIPAGNTYRAWERLRELGGELGLFIYHHYQHVWARDMDPVANQFMLRYRRDRFPARVIYHTAHLHFHKAYWVTVERIADPLHMAEIDALRQSDGSVTVTGKNLEAFSLELPREVVAGNRATVIINGRSAFAGELPGTRELFFEKDGDVWKVGRRPGPTDLVKQPGLSGPIDDAFYGRVLYVWGTQSKDKSMNAKLKELAERRCGRDYKPKYMGRKYFGFYPAKADVDVTPEDLRMAHVVLIGGPAENAITKRMAGKLPVTFAGKSFTFRGKKYAEALHGVKFIYPNPLAPGRYVIVTAANSVEGYEKTSDLRRHIPDWAITDKDGVNEAGFFDNRWK